MADGGETGKREGSRDRGSSGPIFRLEGLEATQMSSGEGRTRPEALVGKVAAGGAALRMAGRHGKRPSVQGHSASTVPPPGSASTPPHHQFAALPPVFAASALWLPPRRPRAAVSAPASLDDDPAKPITGAPPSFAPTPPSAASSSPPPVSTARHRAAISAYTPPHSPLYAAAPPAMLHPGPPPFPRSAKMNASKKKYNHHLGAGGYKKAVKKWQKME
ncbi:extensin-like [Panicum virgatum]|uniref:extensin-like n=1 Tax=Panicum virgatum TaxID=38727 RepID=UPI0019D4F12F|nr:extensin-like [Panicum virgatum]